MIECLFSEFIVYNLYYENKHYELGRVYEINGILNYLYLYFKVLLRFTIFYDEIDFYTLF